jgi:hypothetical protein
MRCYDEPIEVKSGLVADQEGPAQFLWRNRLWVVRAIEDRWLETSPWWEGSAARAVRGETTDEPFDEHGFGSDLVGEREIWRVVAAPGRSGARGICELARSSSTGSWRLRTLLD